MADVRGHGASEWRGYTGSNAPDFNRQGAADTMTSMTALLKDVRACTLCAAHLQLGPRPIVQAHTKARILVASQAPGRKVHETGIPFNDPSGVRLRTWMGVSPETFYDPTLVALLPMGFCFPGTGSSGDLPPRRECAPAWRAPLVAHLRQVQLTLVIGQYAMAYHLPDAKGSLTEVVRAWEQLPPHILPLPHPSPRNTGWLKNNPWFEAELLPLLRQRVAAALQGTIAGE